MNAIGDVKIKSILITHRHGDHLAGFGEITGSVDAPVGIGVEDVSACPGLRHWSLKTGTWSSSATGSFKF